MFKQGVSLLKVGVIMMTLALALLLAAAVVRATLRSEPERLVPAEVATKSSGEAQRYSSGEEGSVTIHASSEKKFPRYPSGEESMGYGSSSSGEPVRQRKEDAKNSQALLQQEEAEPPNSQSPMPQLESQQTPSEASSGPQPQLHKHQQDQPLPGSEGRSWQKPTQGELESQRRTSLRTASRSHNGPHHRSHRHP